MAEKSLLKTVIIGFFIFLLPVSLGWGLVTPYIPENPIVVKAGESQMLELEVQNMEESSKLVSLKVSSENMSSFILQQVDYNMEPMSRKPIFINLSVDKYKHSGNYSALIEGRSKIVDQQSGQVGIGSAVNVRINYTVENRLMDILEMTVIWSIIGLAALGIGLKFYGSLWLCKNRRKK